MRSTAGCLVVAAKAEPASRKANGGVLPLIGQLQRELYPTAKGAPWPPRLTWSGSRPAGLHGKDFPAQHQRRCHGLLSPRAAGPAGQQPCSLISGRRRCCGTVKRHKASPAGFARALADRHVTEGSRGSRPGEDPRSIRSIWPAGAWRSTSARFQQFCQATGSRSLMGFQPLPVRCVHLGFPARRCGPAGRRPSMLASGLDRRRAAKRCCSSAPVSH